MNINALAKKEAIEWVVILSSQDVSSEQEKSFALWLKSSPHNQLAYIQAEKAWFACSAVSTRQQRSANSWMNYAWACSAVVVCAIALLFFSFTGASVTKSETYWVSKAGVETSFLPDGSKITLLPEFEGRFVVDNNAREFEILSGEAFFDVKSDPNKKFVVLTKFGRVEVVGTKFGVRLEGNDASISVLEGVVKIISDDDLQDEVLIKNQRYSFEQMNNRQEIQSFDAENHFLWINGLLVLDGQSIAESVVRLEDLLSVSIRLPDSDTTDVRLVGTISLIDVDAAIRTLASLSGYQVVQKAENEYEFRKD